MGVDRATERERSYVWTAPNWRLGEFDVLQDVSHEPLALELWRGLVRVRAWAGSRHDPSGPTTRQPKPAGDHSDALTLTAGGEPRVAPLLRVFDDLGGAERPSAREVILTCNRVADWAEQTGAFHTAVQFAEAAALVDPADPRLANNAGRVCRRAGDRARAEVWYARGIGLARVSQDKPQYASGYLGLAAVLRDGGEHYRAMKLIRRAGNAARRAGLRAKAAEAYHDALGVATLCTDTSRAFHFAQRALQVYPVHHKRLPAFGHDFAFLLVNLGLYDAALAILTRVAEHIVRPVERLVVLGTLARAAGGSGDKRTYELVLGQIRSMADIYHSTGAGALYSAAEGARLLDRWDEASELTCEAIIAAEEHDAPFVLFLAQRLKIEISGRTPGAPPFPSNNPGARYLDALATELQMRLARWRGRTWRPRRPRQGPET